MERPDILRFFVLKGSKQPVIFALNYNGDVRCGSVKLSTYTYKYKAQKSPLLSIPLL